MRRVHHRKADPHGNGEGCGGIGVHRMLRGIHHHLPVHLLEHTHGPHRLRERCGRRGRTGDRLQVSQETGQDRQGYQVRQLRRRRCHLRYRTPGPFRSNGEGARHDVRVLQQRGVHEHRYPEVLRYREGCVHHDLLERCRVLRKEGVPQGHDRSHGCPQHPLRGTDRPLCMEGHGHQGP